MVLWLFIFKGLKLSPEELTGFLMRAHQPWEIVLVIAGCLQGEGMLTPSTGLGGSTLGVLTTVFLNRFFLDMKGRGCEIQKWCHAGGDEPRAGVRVLGVWTISVLFLSCRGLICRSESEAEWYGFPYPGGWLLRMLLEQGPISSTTTINHNNNNKNRTIIIKSNKNNDKIQLI